MRIASSSSFALVAMVAALAGCGGASVSAVTVGSTTQGMLGAFTADVDVPGRGASPANLYSVNLTMGQPVTISMCENAGSDFDPYLVMTAAGGSDRQSNDDSGGGFHSHGSLIHFTPMVTGTYTIYATTFRRFSGNNTGSYTLQVQAGDMADFRCPSM